MLHLIGLFTNVHLTDYLTFSSVHRYMPAIFYIEKGGGKCWIVEITSTLYFFLLRINDNNFKCFHDVIKKYKVEVISKIQHLPPPFSM